MGKPVALRGEDFDNEPALGGYNGSGQIGDISKINVAEADYALLQSYGANHVHWGIAFSWYMKNMTKFFQVMDQHVAWAKAHHLWLIPVLRTLPMNRSVSDCMEDYTYTCANFWNASSGLQTIVVNFWTDVATHYKNEPTIAGYDILNEPLPPANGITSLWYQGAAQRIHDEILNADPNHFVIVEAGIDGKIGYNFGPRTVFSAHGYDPSSMTHCILERSCSYSYPGNAPADDGTTHYWNQNSYAGNSTDPVPNLRNRMSINSAQAFNVPIYVGEEGTQNGYDGYDQMMTDKFSLYNSWGVSWNHFSWRSLPNDFGIYTSADEAGPLVDPDQRLLDAVRAQWAGAIQPGPTSGFIAPRSTDTWQWQLSNPPTANDLKLGVSWWDVDGFNAPASTIAAIHARGEHAICYIDVGAAETYRPDYSSFPVSILGNSVHDYPNERYVDIRQVKILGPIEGARFDMCKTKGFDSVEPDVLDAYANPSGFPLTQQDQLNYNNMIADLAHARNMSVALKNDPELSVQESSIFDFSIMEQCFAHNDCDLLKPFVAAGKPVFDVEYDYTTAQFCPTVNALGYIGMQKHVSLDSWRQTC
jgi:hypothetical protein